MAYTAQPTGFLASLKQRIKEHTDEPLNDEKWTSDRLFPLIKDAFQYVLMEGQAQSDKPLTVRMDLSVDNTTQTYMLPPNIGRIARIAKVSEDGTEYDAVVPRAGLNPFGPGVDFMGPYIRFAPTWQTSETLRVIYYPNGEFNAHMGTVDCDATSITTSAIPLDSTPTEGYFDRRLNAYLGSSWRLLDITADSGGAQQIPDGYTWLPQLERVVSTYGPHASTGAPMVGFDVPLDFDVGDAGFADSTATYEVVPILLPIYEGAIAWRVARDVHLANGDQKRANGCTVGLRDVMRIIRLEEASFNARSGNSFRADVPGGGRYGFTVGRW